MNDITGVLEGLVKGCSLMINNMYKGLNGKKVTVRYVEDDGVAMAMLVDEEGKIYIVHEQNLKEIEIEHEEDS